MDRNTDINELNNEVIDFFLEDEVRNGFYIPAEMKQFWGAQLILVKEIDGFFKKHDLKYFADWGTLLGTVRHNGYIPWDDDFDIVMMRDDYMRLLKIQEEHPEELPEGVELRSFRNRGDIDYFHGVLVGSSHMCFELSHLKKYLGCPYILAIDVFVLDKKAVSYADQAQMAKDALYTIAIADTIAQNKSLNRATVKEYLDIVSNYKWASGVPKDPDTDREELRRELYEVTESMFAAFSHEDSGKLIQNFPMGLKKPELETDEKCYENSVRLPFEFIDVPVPIRYEEMLRGKYGSYWKIVKGDAIHEYPCYAEQQQALKSNEGYELPEFNIDPDVLRKIVESRNAAKEDNWKKTVSECLTQLNIYKERIETLLSDETEDDPATVILSLLADMQQLVIDLGGFIEQIKGEKEPVIAFLEKMCEKIFLFYDFLSSDKPEMDFESVYREFVLSFSETYDKVKEIIKKKEYVFVSFRASDWCMMEGEYKECIKDPDTDVFVLSIPYYHKSFDGSIKRTIHEPDKYPKYLNVLTPGEYDIKIRRPDRIYIQFPYDSYNPVMTIDGAFFADRLACMTNELVYIPWFKTADFSQKDEPDIVNASHYVKMPGVIYADRVILDSEAKKKVYTDILSDYIPILDKEYWADKIEVRNYEKDSTGTESKRTLLYFVSLYPFIQNGQSAVDKFESNIELFKKMSDKLDVDIILEPAIELNVPILYSKLWEKFSKAMDKAKGVKNLNFINHMRAEDSIKDHCAYYGDVSPCVPVFVTAKKPVMIADYQITE